MLLCVKIIHVAMYGFLVSALLISILRLFCSGCRHHYPRATSRASCLRYSAVDVELASVCTISLHHQRIFFIFLLAPSTNYQDKSTMHTTITLYHFLHQLYK
jgi:hypothetical protein